MTSSSGHISSKPALPTIEQILSCVKSGAQAECARLLRMLAPVGSSTPSFHLLRAIVLENSVVSYLACEAAQMELELFPDNRAAQELLVILEEKRKAREIQAASVPQEIRFSLVVAGDSNYRVTQRVVEAALYQSYRNIELLVVQSEPNAEASEALSSRDPRVRVLQAYGATPWQAIEFGLQHTSGQYQMVIPNSTVVFSNYGFQILSVVLPKLATADFVCTERAYLDELCFPHTMRCPFLRGSREFFLDTRNFRPPSATLSFTNTVWSAKLFQKVGNRLATSLREAVDFELFLRFLRESKATTVTTSLALGHVAVEARSEQLSPRYIEEASLLIEKEKSEYPLSPRDSQAGAQANIQSSQETVPAGFKMAKPARSPSSGIRRLLQERGPTISIVTPSFNQAEFLEATIDSILSQGYPRLEYAIIDGGSTDASLDIIKKYERHLTFWCSERDGGQYFAIQKGLARSMGEVMSWLNSDDKLVPHSLEYLALVFMLYPDIRWVSGRHGSILQSGAEEIGARATPLSREHYLREGFDNPFIQQEGTFWRRSLWHDAGGALDLKFSLAGDMDLWRRFFRHAALHRIDLPIGLFRVHPAQRSQLLQVQYYREAEDATREELALIQQGAFTQMIPAPPVLSESDILEAAERFVVGGGHAVQIFIKDLCSASAGNEHSRVSVTYNPHSHSITV